MVRKMKVEIEDSIFSYLESHTDYSKKKIKKMIEHGQIKVNGEQIKLPYMLKIDDIIDINTTKQVQVPFQILYEDENMLITNKRSGLLTVGTKVEKELTLYHQAMEYLHQKKEKIFVVHRLDKDTSGIVLFAKKEAIQKSLQENWNQIVLSRKYVAIVHGKVSKEGTIESYLKEDKSTFVYSAKTGKKAITDYRLIKEKDGLSFIDISLKTGRKNQIRVHMKENYTPVAGDKKYGQKDSFPRLMLHAYQLSFILPYNHRKYSFETEIPPEFLKYVQ